MRILCNECEEKFIQQALKTECKMEELGIKIINDFKKPNSYPFCFNLNFNKTNKRIIITYLLDDIDIFVTKICNTYYEAIIYLFSSICNLEFSIRSELSPLVFNLTSIISICSNHHQHFLNQQPNNFPFADNKINSHSTLNEYNKLNSINNDFLSKLQTIYDIDTSKKTTEDSVQPNNFCRKDNIFTGASAHSNVEQVIDSRSIYFSCNEALKNATIEGKDENIKKLDISSFLITSSMNENNKIHKIGTHDTKLQINKYFRSNALVELSSSNFALTTERTRESFKDSNSNNKITFDSITVSDYVKQFIEYNNNKLINYRSLTKLRHKSNNRYSCSNYITKKHSNKVKETNTYKFYTIIRGIHNDIYNSKIYLFFKTTCIVINNVLEQNKKVTAASKESCYNLDSCKIIFRNSTFNPTNKKKIICTDL